MFAIIKELHLDKIVFHIYEYLSCTDLTELQKLKCRQDKNLCVFHDLNLTIIFLFFNTKHTDEE